jgi:glycerol uptake facilitator-like aquaporin
VFPACCDAVYTFANISGAHLNPAVSFALMCTGHMKWWRGLLYMVMQVRVQVMLWASFAEILHWNRVLLSACWHGEQCSHAATTVALRHLRTSNKITQNA